MTDLTDVEKVDVRRHCGYPAYGGSLAGPYGWQYLQSFGLLEYRLNNLSNAELSVVRSYLSTLAALEAAIPNAAGNLDTDEAAMWVRNRSEVDDRRGLFDDWRRRLCAFLGTPSGPGLVSRAGILVV